MLYGDRNDMRQVFFQVWQKAQNNDVLQPQEAIIADIIGMHPEYQRLLSNPSALEREYDGSDGQVNPFLHMGLHIAIREQISTNMPFGIVNLYQQYVSHCGDVHASEHEMIESLAEAMWEAQVARREPDQQAYLEKLRRRLPSRARPE